MARTSSKPIEKPAEPATSEKEIDTDEDFESSEYVSLSDDAEKDLKKMVARRKLEIYWEKTRLKDQFESGS